MPKRGLGIVSLHRGLAAPPTPTSTPPAPSNPIGRFGAAGCLLALAARAPLLLDGLVGEVVR
eukprot:9302585-Pyramimonas_sp.AAC.1